MVLSTDFIWKCTFKEYIFFIILFLELIHTGFAVDGVGVGVIVGVVQASVAYHDVAFDLLAAPGANLIWDWVYRVLGP